MIQDHKLVPALQALNTILTRARWMAYEAKAPELAELLDAAEILPTYIADSDDFTAVYEATLEDIAREFECCAHIADDFKKEETVVQ